MRPLALLAGIGMTAAATPAMADFSLIPLQPSIAGSRQTAPPGDVAPAPVPIVSQPLPPPDPPRPAFSTARGFGRQVPLSFAVRQIVPPRFAVKFGGGVDPNAPTDWTGGRPWNAVLQDSLRPLGLKLVMHAKSVTIEPANRS